jgi:hypothetical protein
MLTDYSRLLQNHEDLLNVRHFVKPASVAIRAPIFGWRLESVQDPKAYPRAWVVHEVDRRHRTMLFSTASMIRHQPAQSRGNRSAVAAIFGPASATVEPVRFRSYEADQILLDVTAESPGLLILSELDYQAGVLP